MEHISEETLNSMTRDELIALKHSLGGATNLRVSKEKHIEIIKSLLKDPNSPYKYRNITLGDIQPHNVSITLNSNAPLTFIYPSNKSEKDLLHLLYTFFNST
jgi:hypothetical protein